MKENPSFERISRYYDNNAEKLLSDYVHGNLRLQSAIEHTLRWLPKDCASVLDIGFGLGWSTFEIKRHFPESRIDGVDSSARLVYLAKRLFPDADISFAVCDITAQNSQVHKKSYDAIVMLDVYEHIPKSKRRLVHKALANALGQNGILILSFPSVMHQCDLRVHHPQSIQPVDEDVTFEDIGQLAKDLDAQVLHYSNQSLGHTNDYVHVALQREPKFHKTASVKRNIDIETDIQRRTRVEKKLRVKVLKENLILEQSHGPRICVATPQLPGLTETFIKAHIQRLPAEITVLHGGWSPLFCNDEPLLRMAPLFRLLRGIATRVFNLEKDYFQNAAIKKLLKDRRTRAVLAEYGPVGVGMLKPCKESRVPLIVHFHGADAYAHKFVAGKGESYCSLFASAAAIIAVSREMYEQLLHLGAPEEKLYYNPYGVDVDDFRGSNPETAPPIFLAAGRFVDKKAPYLTLLAFEKITRDYPGSRLIIVGQGPLWESCKQMSRALGLNNEVSFPGTLPHAEVANLMRQARAFVQHSIRPDDGDSEGTPLAVLEAGASGLPVVATRHGGIQDVVIDGDTGFLVPEGDVPAMAEKMSKLAGDPSLAQRMGQSGRRRICSEFSAAKSISGLWEIIVNVMQ